MKEKILLIEDEKLMRITVEDALRSAGYDVMAFEKGKEALAALEGNVFSVVVTDVRLPDMDGFEIVREINRRGDMQTIVMTAYGTIKDAVEAMKLGAFDYITKPFSLDEFLLLTARALEVKKLREENVRLKKDINRCYAFPNIIAESEEMKRVLMLVERVARTDSTVLILGESGTGKELIATTIHYQSMRKDNPLIKVNCAALPEGLIESELFGHEKGAFTGAVRRKPGRFELADTGTIFLDEIGDMPPQTQAKVLRILQDRTFERVGGTETLSIDVRVITATNRNLEEEVKKGRFREDLFYRLNVIPITVPPLRDRKEDIPYLVDFFAKKFGGKMARAVSFAKDAIDTLMAYDFPGNVRELENIVERSVALVHGETVSKGDVAEFIFSGAPDTRSLLLSDIAAEAEKAYIRKILKAAKGNRTRASEMLGISRKTLWEKIHAYKIVD